MEKIYFRIRMFLTRSVESLLLLSVVGSIAGAVAFLVMAMKEADPDRGFIFMLAASSCAIYFTVQVWIGRDRYRW